MNTIPITKYIAHAGRASRRKAEALVRDGKVTVNGEAAQLGMQVQSHDEVAVNGEVVRLREHVYIALHKPVGYVCTTRTHNSEKNVLSLVTADNAVNADDAPLAKHKSRLHLVGRLDKDSSGLVIATNDGDFTLQATHPRYQHEKEYEVRVTGLDDRDEAAIEAVAYAFKHGIAIGEGDGTAHAKKCEYVGRGVFRVILTEGKKRQIRRMFGALGYRVQDLVRVRMGEIELGTLPSGKWQALPADIAQQLTDGAR